MEMMNDQLKQLSHTLRLFGVHGGFEKRAEQAGAQSLNHLEFLRLILEDEINQRKSASAKRLITRAKFRSFSDLEDWDQTFERGLTKVKLRELAAIGFYQSRENLLLLGRTGEGKTHLAIAIGRRLCAENISTLFLPVNFLFEEVMAAKATGKYLSFVKRLTNSQVIVLDDFGLRSYTHEEANVLVDLLEDRHQKGSVVVTSQVDPKGWLKLFEDPVIAEAIVSRLEHPSQRIILNGGNYREKLQKHLPAGKKLEEKKMLN
jgi:DNA replication protein DnaC